MHGEGALTATLQIVSKPLKYETSHDLTDHNDCHFRILGICDSHNYVSQPLGGLGVSTISCETPEYE
jgi:hypothetical protein